MQAVESTLLAGAASTPGASKAPGPLDLVRLVARFNLHPEHDLHPSWLPPDWPVRHRRLAAYGPAAHGVLADLLRRRTGVAGDEQINFDGSLRRLALIDGRSLRRLAIYCGLCAHKPLFKLRGVSAQLRRQARRLDQDAALFVIDRMPVLTRVQMDAEALQARPLSTGRLVSDRGYRLLMGVLARESEPLLRRVQFKLPRRIASLGVPRLDEHQAAQLAEIMLLCIVPERLPQWDWLF